MAKAHRSIPTLSPQDAARFWSKVDRRSDSECWKWTAGRGTRGYGRFKAKGDTYFAHRVAYKLHYEEEPVDTLVCHHCDNPPCCNPAHLYAGEHADNSRDMVRRGRQNTPSGDDHYTRRTPELMRRGEKHHKTTLEADDVRAIRKLYKETGLSHRVIADRYGVSRECIGVIIRRQTWGHID